MKLKGLWGASLVLVAMAASSCDEEQSAPLPEPTPATVRTTSQEANSTRKVLILGSTVAGGQQSQEAQAVASLGMAVEVVTPAQWAAMTAEQFMSYRALVIGDAACTEGTAAWQAALDTRATWGAIVDGNIIAIGSNVATNSFSAQGGQLDPVVQGAIEFAAERPRFTGLYASLGCAYRSAPATGTAVDLLSPFGTFKAAGANCTVREEPALAYVPSQYPDTFIKYFGGASGLIGVDLCVAKSVFVDYPKHEFSIGSLALQDPGTAMPGASLYYDFDNYENVTGTPFILTRGTMATGLGCGGLPENIPSDQECDLGESGNGQPALDNPPEPTCSFTCKSTWCGDGIIQPELGETCDNATNNGRNLQGNIENGMCTKLCRVVNVPDPNRAPVARCKNATVVVTDTCGGFASINDGSSDPDGDTITCTQNPGSYPFGTTTATLTCTDPRGKSASCSATVSVVDQTAPVLALAGSLSMSLQCGVDTYTEPGATATDVCDSAPAIAKTITRDGAPVTAVSNKPRGVYEVSYTAKDSSNNTSAAQKRTVTVSDTLKPNIVLSGLVNQNLECGTAYSEAGGSVSDQCDAIPWTRVVRGGTVDNKKLGPQPLTYDVSDDSGNAATQVTRTVTVRDTTRPVLTVAPYTTVPVECGDPNFAHPPVAVTELCDPGPFTLTPSRVVNPRLVGGQSLTYSTFDKAGNQGVSGTRTFDVKDNLPPALTLLGASPLPLECGDPFADPGATANDQCAGDRTGFITKTHNVDNKNPGSYGVTYTVADPSGKTTTANRPVNVADTLAPQVTMNGASSVAVECGDPAYADQGASANDKCDGPLTAVASRVVDPKLPGSYNVTYSATDRAGRTGTAAGSRTVTVSDNLPPMLTMNGPASMGLECGTAYSEAGATASDQCAGNLPVDISGNVDHQRPGSYTRTYAATDGKFPVSATRAVAVSDTLAPAVTMVGSPTAQLECGTGPFADPGATASDACAGQLPALPTRVVDQRNPGNYVIGYEATDPSGNKGTAAGTRTVTVVDTQEPTLVLNGAAAQTVQCGTAFNDQGATANDLCRGSLPVTKTGGVNANAVGNYELTYNATDGAFNKSVTRAVTVEDTLVPDITVLGSTNDSYECGSTYTDPGATASDTCDTSVAVTSAQTGDPSQPGTISITYTATDDSGNTRTLAGARTVTVNDNTPPVLVRNGAATASLECGTAYNDLGATANDACAGDLTANIQTVNPVSTGTPGSYTVRYNVADPAGRSAPEVTRVVTVSDTQAPQVTVTGPLNQAVECGSGTYTDPGASALDGCAGPLPAVPSVVVDRRAPGPYAITYSATDPSGNTGTAADTRTVTVQDTLPPTLALNGSANPGLECGTPFNDPGASANDECRGTLAVSKNGNVNHLVPGSYPLTYEATDGQQTVSATRTVGVSDTLKPAITVLGPANDTFECGSTYVDPGATASDICDTSVAVTSAQTGDPSQPGSISITYTATDDAGNVTVAANARTVTVNDNEPPVLALNGQATLGLECGGVYEEQGAVANDACFGDVTNRIQIGGAVNPAAPGTYTRTYNVSDQAGRAAPQLTRTINVTDTVAPTISVLPPFAQTFECGSGPYNDPGATAADSCAGNLTNVIERLGSVNGGAAGAYTLSYRVTDPSGNQTTAAQTRTVTVTDTSAPVISLTGPATLGLECGTAYTEQGATANDACAGDLTGNIQTTGPVNSGVAGTYTRTYRVTDPSGQSAQTSRQVNVSDTQAPTLSLVGPATQLVECNGQYADPGAQATDLCNGDLTANISRSGMVDPAVLGPYTVRYNVKDLSDNAAPELTRAVTVRDSLAPSIEVNGPLAQQHECGSTYMDPGATANDQCAGDLTAAIQAARTGNPNAPGSFTIRYSVTDPSGNSVTSPVTRTVTVNDETAPVLALVGPGTVNLECGTPYNDQGASANDACFGDLTASIQKSGTVNVNVPAQYQLNFNVTDPAGQSAPTVSRTVNVNDTQAPTLSIVGPLEQTYECGTTYQDPGATANDTCAGDVTGRVVSTRTPVPGQPGTVSISYSVTDPSGNKTDSNVSRTVRMIDEEAPVVVLNGSATETKECGTPYVDPGASASDTCVGPLPVTVAGAVDHTTAGLYTLTYRAEDLVGNFDQKTRQVRVNDTQGPVITLNGSSPMVLECKVDAWVDPGASATDLCSGAEDVVASGTVNVAQTGAYLITYNSKDNSNNSAVPVIRNVLVQDNLAPTITLNGPNPMVLECALGNLNNDPMAKVEDACYGDTSHTVFREFTNLNINQVGNYYARYQGDDTVGHVVQINRDLQVVDTTAPVLTVQNPGETVECGTQPSLGVTATDACYGPVAVIATPASLPSEPGQYTVTYSAVDPAGNAAAGNGLVTRTITVEDTTEPVLSIADQDVYYECTGYAIGNVWNAPEATATDLCEGSLIVHQYNTGDDDEDGVPGSIDPDDFGPGPTTEVEGLYYVQYLAWDETYNIQGAILSVYVRDTIKPVLGLNPDNDGGDPAYEQVECFLPRNGGDPDPQPYTNPGAWAEDQCYGDLNQEVVSFGEVNKQVPGIYTLSYQVRDGAYNWAEELTRTVEVIDSQLPTVTDRNTSLVPSDGTMRTVELSQCAVAEDRCEGYLPINLVGCVTNITSNQPGDDAGDIVFEPCATSFQLRAEANASVGSREYTVEFTVSDSSGNATQSQCVVRVAAPPVVASPANGGVSNTNTPTYSGTAQAGTTITIVVDNNSVGTTTATPAGTWSFTQPTALGNGAHTVRVIERDSLGNNSPSALVTFNVQTTLAGR